MTINDPSPRVDLHSLALQLKQWARELGFSALGISSTDLGEDEIRLLRWLEHGRHGDMHYMARHGSRRSRPAELVPGTVRVISVRMDYWRAEAHDAERVLEQPALGYVARYALGRDYHKVLRNRLQKLAERIATVVGDFGYRAFTDSAPVLEKPLARNAGLGWVGKHTNLINRDTGSWFFLGELYTDLPLPVDSPAAEHCGSCTACMSACPTNAIVAPFELDARRCISYLTIELHGPIPEALRSAVGNRIFGCDDCQLVCPWNKFTKMSAEQDFSPRHDLDHATLVDLFAWTEFDFMEHTRGSAIRRLGYERWLRNIAVALGNAPTEPGVVEALRSRLDYPSALVVEHVRWALLQHRTAS